MHRVSGCGDRNVQYFATEFVSFLKHFTSRRPVGRGALAPGKVGAKGYRKALKLGVDSAGTVEDAEGRRYCQWTGWELGKSKSCFTTLNAWSHPNNVNGRGGIARLG